MQQYEFWYAVDSRPQENVIHPTIIFYHFEFFFLSHSNSAYMTRFYKFSFMSQQSFLGSPRFLQLIRG